MSNFEPVRIDAAHDLTEQAGRHLRRALGPLAGRLTVVCDHDAVYVAGRVTSWYQKQQAQECLREMASGRAIYNDLLVAS